MKLATTRFLLTGAIVLGAWAGLVHAESITLTETSLADLLGAEYTEAWSFLNSDTSDGNLYSEVHSQAFTNGDRYVYLYQVVNTGVPGNATAEMFTLGEFAGTLEAGDIGYLSGSVPTEFTAGSQMPESEGYIEWLSNGWDISFYYTKRSGCELSPGETSRVMFICSDCAPGLIFGSVIDHNVASGLVVGAVPAPEPTTAVLLVFGGLAALVCAVRRGRRNVTGSR